MPIYRLITLLVGILAISVSNLFADELNFSDSRFADWELVMAEDSVPADQLVKIKSDSLTLFGKDHPKGIFRTKAAYSDYELSLEWRWPNTPGNGGVMLHCDPEVTTAAWPTCLEVQLKHGRAGNFRKNGESISVEPERTTQKPFIPRLVDDVEKPLGEWNSLRVIAKNDQIEVFINGKLVNKGDRATASSGFIALQLELADIQFRSVRLKKISNLAAEERDKTGLPYIRETV